MLQHDMTSDEILISSDWSGITEWVGLIKIVQHILFIKFLQ